MRSNREMWNTIMLTDILSETAGYLLALSIKFGSGITRWQVQLYTTVYILILMLYFLLSLGTRIRRTTYPVAQMDPLENLARLVKDRLIQYVLLIVLLFLAHTFSQISRLALGLAGVFDVALSYACRMAVRHREKKREAQREITEHYVAVTTRPLGALACARVRELLPPDADLAGVRYIDEENAPGGESYFASDRHSNRGRSLSEVVLRGLPEHAHVMVYLPDPETAWAEEKIVRICRGVGIPVGTFVFAQGMELPQSAVDRKSRCAVAWYPEWNRKGTVFGVRFNIATVDSAVVTVLDEIRAGRAEGGAADPAGPEAGREASAGENVCAQMRAGVLSGEYICFSNVHTTVMAHNDAGYRAMLNGAAYVFPDGAPIAQRLRGKFEDCGRVAGPDFMDAVFRATMDGSVSHYFYGSTPETIERLQAELPKRYPGIRIAGAVSPPFRPETDEEDAASVAAMNASGASLIWIGLGAPKQERWMAAHRGRVGGVMLGVGAGFDFYAGTVKRAPMWIQKLGLEWLYRMARDPKRLVSRYVVTNAQYCLYTLKDALTRRR